jgi:hypothetical protein
LISRLKSPRSEHEDDGDPNQFSKKKRPSLVTRRDKKKEKDVTIMANADVDKRHRTGIKATDKLESSLITAIPLLVQNAFVSGPELETIALVSKALYHAATNDDAWKSLCSIEYPCTHIMPHRLLAKTSYRWLYWQWKTEPLCYWEQDTWTGDCSDPMTPISPPSCSVKDIHLYVNVRYKEKHIASIDIQGEDLAVLMQIGELHISFPKHEILCPAEWDDDVFCGSYYRNSIKCYDGKTKFPFFNKELLAEHFNVTVHMLRLSDMTMCCILSSRGMGRSPACAYPAVEKGDKVNQDSKIDVSRVVEHGSIILWIGEGERGELLAMQPTNLGEKILSRLNDSQTTLHLDIRPIYSVGRFGHLAITGISAHLMKLEDRFNLCPLYPTSHCGVTYLHFLSELQGTPFPQRDLDRTLAQQRY